ncbi:hypothetical protein LguiA_024977 [Lonicera macranthoides]
MRRNCNLELCLVPPSTNNDNNHHQALMNMFNGTGVEKKDQQLTIFYNGRITACDVTELQARAIILLASKEMEESKTPTSPPLMTLQSQLYSPSGSSTGLSMKKSLQRFLQKRKHRIQATSPY